MARNGGGRRPRISHLCRGRRAPPGGAAVTEETLLAVALEKPPPARAAFLAACCAGRPGRRRRVADLLAAHDRAGDFLEPVNPLCPTAPLPGAGAPHAPAGHPSRCPRPARSP